MLLLISIIILNNQIKYLNSYKKLANLAKKPFDVSLTKRLKRRGGRNNFGRITVRHQGGGHKRRSRLIYFNFLNSCGIISSIGYDPTRNLSLQGINSETGKSFYTLLSRVLKVGYIVGKKKEIAVSLDSFAVFGIISNLAHRSKNLSKARRSRWLGKRPSVRGVAMNPIDHPHGGGEGKTSGGRPSVTPWGRLTRGKPTKKLKQF